MTMNRGDVNVWLIRRPWPTIDIPQVDAAAYKSYYGDAMETVTFFGLDTDRVATMLKAIGHPVRLEILQTLSAGGDDNCCVDFTRHASLAQSTVSQHLRVLKDAGLIKY